MFRVSSKHTNTDLINPSVEETEAFIDRAANKQLVAVEIKRIEQVLNLLMLPGLQNAFSSYMESRIISLRSCYKKLVSTSENMKSSQCLLLSVAVYDRSFNNLKSIRRSLEALVNKFLMKPKAYLCLENLNITIYRVEYTFSIEETYKEKQLLIELNNLNWKEGRRPLSKALLGISETFLWFNDQHANNKLSNFALSLVIHFKNNFHKLLNAYRDNQINDRAVVTLLEPVALFLSSLEQGLRRYPKIDRHVGNAQTKHALVPRLS
jgi:hypothetical protein